MPNEPELIEFRVISGTGSLRFPVGKSSERKYWLYADLLRLPDPNYTNKKFPAPKGNYANIQFRRTEYILRTETMEFESQGWVFESDPLGQTLLSNQCYARATAENMKAIAEAQGLFVELLPFEEVELLACDYDDILVKCRDGCAISLRLYSQAYQLCPDQEPNPVPPPEPDPPPNPPAPPGTPFDGTDPTQPTISPPYDDPPDPNEYNPFPGDNPSPEPPEEGDECARYALFAQVTYASNSGPVTLNAYGTVYAPFTQAISIDTNPQGSAVVLKIQCRGIASCGESGQYIFADMGYPGSQIDRFSNAVLITATKL